MADEVGNQFIQQLAPLLLAGDFNIARDINEAFA